MGNIKLFSSCSCSNSIADLGRVRKNDAPNPHDFQVGEMKAHGDFVVARVVYPSCTNYGGKKILVFKGCKMSDIKQAPKLDPHFCLECGPSPIARFKPTEEGWLMAVAFIKMCSRK